MTDAVRPNPPAPRRTIATIDRPPHRIFMIMRSRLRLRFGQNRDQRVGWVELLRLGKYFFSPESGSMYDSVHDESHL
jgi:hypothetical protein